MRLALQLPSAWVESISREPPTAHAPSSSVVEYGPYSAMPPFSFSPMRLHFENNAPFVHANLTVQYEVRPPAMQKLRIETLGFG
jgi:oligosaccharyltransferase complex subunit alpha (ribophorin I)